MTPVSEQRLEHMQLVPVGDSKTVSKTITEAESYLFTGLTGDLNPCWMDAVQAAAAGGRMAPPALAVALVSGVLARFSGRVPAPGAVSKQYTLRAGAPIRFGDTLSCRLEVTEHRPDRFEAILTARCTNQAGAEVLSGRCVLKIL